jgi:glycosyltransferase involved in cell wall biosynthesis
MKILILTQYFPPETGAPQNRLHSLAGYFSYLGAEVSILTAMPNYPKMEVFDGYKGKFYKYEEQGNIKVHRAWIFVSKSKSVIFRLLNYFSFVFSSLLVGIFKINKHDIIICESPPLFLGISALILKWFKNSKLVFNVSDLWPESAEKLDIVTNKLLLNISYKLEGILYTHSNLVSGQTQGIVKNISDRFPLVKTYWLPNGIDFNQYNILANGADFRLTYAINSSDFILMYAGILGYAQGLDVIIKSAFISKNFPEIKYVIIGDGPEKEKLKKLAKELKLENVLFVGNIPRENMSNAIAACNAYIVPLKKNDLFLGAIPSKLFEPLAMGKPILLGVDGEARELFIEKGNGGLFFTPEDADGLAEKVLYLNANRNEISILGDNGKKFVSINFNREKLAKLFFEKLESLNDN